MSAESSGARACAQAESILPAGWPGFAALLCLTFLIRAAGWLSAQDGSTGRALDEVGSILTIFLSAYLVALFLVSMCGPGARAIPLYAWAILLLCLSSSVGALLRRQGWDPRGAREPGLHTLLEHSLELAPQPAGGPFEALLTIHFDQPSPAFRERMRAAARGLSNLSIELPIGGCERDCSISVESGEISRTVERRIFLDFNMSIPLERELAASFERSGLISLRFRSSSSLRICARDIGLQTRQRTDTLLVNGTELPIPMDGIVFVRFKFRSAGGVPEAFFY